MAGWLDAIYDAVWPAFCQGCGTDGSWWCNGCDAKVLRVASPICPACRKLTPHGQYCARCRKGRFLTGIIAGAAYRPPLTSAIKSLKYRHAGAIAPQLAAYPLKNLERLHRSFGCLIPVPLHFSRQRRRGHNQAEQLAMAIRKQAGVPIERGLRRQKPTSSQTGLRRDARKRNVEDAFRWSGQPLHGQSVLLVDDVVTTGATLNACAKELRRAGARQVWGLVVGIR